MSLGGTGAFGQCAGRTGGMGATSGSLLFVPSSCAFAVSGNSKLRVTVKQRLRPKYVRAIETNAKTYETDRKR